MTLGLEPDSQLLLGVAIFAVATPGYFLATRFSSAPQRKWAIDSRRSKVLWFEAGLLQAFGLINVAIALSRY